MYLVLFVILIIGLLWLFQVVLLDDFYRYFKTQMVNSSGEILAQNMDNPDLDALANQLSNKNSICVLILDENRQTLISCEASISCVLHKANAQTLAFFCQQADEENAPHLRLFTMEHPAMTAMPWTAFPGGFRPRKLAPRSACCIPRR